MREKGFSMVVAVDEGGGIGKDGGLPWSLKGDMRWFKELTLCPDREAVLARWRLNSAIIDSHVLEPDQVIARIAKEPPLPTPAPDIRNAVIMGRRTWEGLPERFKPLPSRVNVVLSRDPTFTTDGRFHLFRTLDEALASLLQDETVSQVFVIGGGALYREALSHPKLNFIYRTDIQARLACDTHFPNLTAPWVELAAGPVIAEENLRYRIKIFGREKQAF